MRKWISVFSVCTVLFLAACGNAEDNARSGENEESIPAAIEANISVPSDVSINEKVTIEVSVTQGDQPVEDADEVKFELWEDGKKDDSVIIEARHDNNGTYKTDFEFETDGIYHVQSHVTARNMHTMPTVEVNVGDVKNNESEEEAAHDHSEDVSIHLSPTDDVIAAEETMLTIHITKKEQALVEANVRLEIISASNEHQVEWVDAIEGADGMYTVAQTFAEKGQYEVIVHVENDEGLHEHNKYDLTVK